MLNRQIRRTAERVLPDFLLRWLDPFEAFVSERLQAFSNALPTPSCVLDAGAGECRYASLFVRHRYISLDSAVGDGSWDYSRLNTLGDLEQLPFAPTVFDAAISVVVLEHTRNPLKVLCETGRVLRPGGKLFLVVPSQWEEHQIPNDFFRFTRFGVEHLLEQSGFRIETIEPVGGFFWLLARRCVNLLAFFQGGLKWVLFALLAPFFGFLFPVALYFLDGLDRRKEFTLGYVCVASR
ncbi:MAG: class I SAM-dependent methyltransferase [Acidobacteriia bacterium]|nr:class I SAM-dependent methyltransferase [Terriglobia bacterium]